MLKRLGKMSLYLCIDPLLLLLIKQNGLKLQQIALESTFIIMVCVGMNQTCADKEETKFLYTWV